MSARGPGLFSQVLPLTVVGLCAALAAMGPTTEPPDPQVGQSFRVPYRLTDTNHWLVRVRLNGQGPYHFLVDSGAPALYIGTEAARDAGITPAEDDYWTRLDRLDIEGGAVLTGLNARVEDPFQLTGMNALGLPGVTIDGILGYSVLARYRLLFDPSDDRMTWTRLDHDPRDPYIPRSLRTREGPKPPAGVQAMQAMGPLMKVAAAFVGKQPPDQLHPQGFLGLEIAGSDPTRAADDEEKKPSETGAGVPIVRVLDGTPAAQAGLREGDRIVRVGSQAVHSPDDAHEALAQRRIGERLTLTIVRADDEAQEIALTTAGGF